MLFPAQEDGVAEKENQGGQGGCADAAIQDSVSKGTLYPLENLGKGNPEEFCQQNCSNQSGGVTAAAQPSQEKKAEG